MKRLLTILIAVAGFLSGATKLNLGDVRGLPNAPSVPYLLAFTSSGWVPVIADPGGSIVLDTTGGVAILKATAGGSQPIDVTEDLTFTTSAAFTTANPVRGALHVFRNGVLQRSGQDYTATADSTGRQTVGLAGALQGDFVTLDYQK